jgi:hypothetical protein
MKKIIIWAKWFLYLLITRDARLRYSYGKMKGMHVISMKHDFLGTSLAYDPNRKPEREYLTREEFFKTEEVE